MQDTARRSGSWSRACALVRATLVGLLVLQVGCASVPPGTSLARPQAAARTLERTAWLAPVRVDRTSGGDPRLISSSLGASIANYLEEARLFRNSSQLPGRVGPDDLVLHFHFERFEMEREVHPAYFPLAILTATLYIWFGGPIYQDRVALSGSLRVDSGAGTPLAEANESIDEGHSVSLWSPDYAMPSGADERTTFVRSLLDAVIGQIAND